MLLRSIQKPIHCTSGGLVARARFSTTPVLRLQVTERLTSASDGGNGPHAPREQPNQPGPRSITKSLASAFWASIAFGLVTGFLVENHSRQSKRGATPVVPTPPPSVKTPVSLSGPPSKVIDAMIELKEDSDSTKYFVIIATAYEGQNTNLDKVTTRLIFYIGLLQAAFIPSLAAEELLQEHLPIWPNPCGQLNKLVEEAKDPRAVDLLRQAEAKIHAIRVSACKEIHDLLLSDEVITGRMKPIDVVKAMIEPIQKVRFSCSSNIYQPVWDRLCKRLIAVSMGKTGKRQPKETSRDEQNHTVLG